jgi:predicted ATPase/class 3 adenylate cyclase
MTARPTGTVTFLFTDIEGSTRLVQRLGPSYADLLVQHHRLLREAVAAGDGSEVKTEGDSFFVVFPKPIEALRVVADAQRALERASWPGEVEVAVRMGLHTGDVALAGDEYVGVEIHRAARIAAAAHGGQVVLSAAMQAAVAADLPHGTSLRDLGLHRLKDLDEPEHLYQLVIDGVRNDFPPLRSLSARFDLLPTEVSSFIGRGPDMQRISPLLARTRLLTLVGPGGSGKTRLALAVARHRSSGYADGVAFVPLSAISDPRLVASAIRHALGFSEEVGRNSVETLVDRLGRLDVLLVLDNFEHVLEASTDVGAILAGTERLTILVTSRAALHIAGEQEYAVQPLGLPKPGEIDDFASVERAESVILFVERARQVLPDFELRPSNVYLVARICARLDGLPLAIELAASRVRLLPLDAILDRLERRLELLRGTGRDRDVRHRTLRGTIDWSHDLLAFADRVVFRRLGVFMGGATLDAIDDLVPSLGDPGVESLDALEALTDQSLLRADGSASEPRFVMLETIREYALERLAEAEEADAMAAAHGRWYLGLVARVASDLTKGPGAADRLEADHDNVRIAFRWAIDQGQTELALRSAGAIWRFWHLRGHLREGRRICEEVLAMPGVDAVPEARARALYALASVHYWSSDVEAARREYEQALDSARQAGANEVEAEALYALGYVLAFAKRWDQAYEAFEASGALYERIGDRLGLTLARYSKAFTFSLAGHWAEAAPGLEEVLPEFDALGEDFWRYTSRLVLGRTLQRLGQLDRADELAREGLAGAAVLGDATMRAMALRDLGAVSAMQGQHDRALRLVGASRGLEDVVGGQAPDELVNILDPIELAREAGMADLEIDRLVREGRSLSTESALELAEGRRAESG